MRYELMLILDPKQSDKEIEKVLGEIKKSAEEHELNLNDEDVWGVRPLAYKIRGNKDGYYVVYLFEGETGGIEGFKKDLRIQAGLVRNLLIKMDDDYNVILRYERGAKAAKLSDHAAELSKKVRSKKKDEPADEKSTEADAAKLDEKLKAIEQDTDIAL